MEFGGQYAAIPPLRGPRHLSRVLHFEDPRNWNPQELRSSEIVFFSFSRIKQENLSNILSSSAIIVGVRTATLPEMFSLQGAVPTMRVGTIMLSLQDVDRVSMETCKMPLICMEIQVMHLVSDGGLGSDSGGLVEYGGRSRFLLSP